MCCGLGDGVMVAPPVTAVANPVNPVTGSTFWDFVNQSASYTPQSFFQKYETPLLLGGASC